MVRIICDNETEVGFDSEIHIEGDANIVVPELVAVFNHIYQGSSKLFEMVLLECDYTKHITGDK